MEPSGRNQWQPVADEVTAKTAQTAENRCRGLRPVAAEAPWVRRGRRFESVRGLCKSAACRRFFVRIDLLPGERAVGMEPFMEPSGRKRPLRERDRRSFYPEILGAFVPADVHVGDATQLGSPALGGNYAGTSGSCSAILSLRARADRQYATQRAGRVWL
jgi:hypothetical protein